MTESVLDERFSGVLAPDAVLPSQYFEALRRRRDMSGERRLMVAVLEDALHCFQKYVDAEDAKHRQMFLDAESWIMADNPTWFFSFESVCDTLDLDPDYVREGLMRWRDARRREAVVLRGHASARSFGEDAVAEEEPLRRASGA
jgi:hypothetical protein